jgi:uncharacterized protein YndB with AHSA1/START domain
MRAPHLVFISRFRLESDPMSVWRMLAAAATWPHWWPGPRVAGGTRARSSIAGSAMQAAAGHQDCRWGRALAIVNPLHLDITFADPPRLIEGRVSGLWLSSALWLVEPAMGPSASDVTLRWECVLHRPWMLRVKWLIRPVLACCHFNGVRVGARAVAKRLGCRLSDLTRWSGGPE